MERADIADNEKISIHAPTRGATAYLDTLESQAEFQSTLPRGERLETAIDAAIDL